MRKTRKKKAREKFYFPLRSFSIQRAQLSRSLEQASLRHPSKQRRLGTQREWRILPACLTGDVTVWEVDCITQVFLESNTLFIGTQVLLEKEYLSKFSLYATKEGLPMQLFPLTLRCLETDKYAIALDQV